MVAASQIVGIVNVTGDSFSEGGSSAPESGAERASQLLECGADVVEFGAESTRPGATEIPAGEAKQRPLPAIDAPRVQPPGRRSAVDPRNGACARAALERGAAYIGDVSMLRHDPSMAETVAAFPDAELVLCHSRGTPGDMCDEKYQDYGEDVVETVIEELSAAAGKAVDAGVPEKRIVFDPGFGFGKSVAQQWTMFRQIARFKTLGRIFVGVSRKSFLGAVAGMTDPSKRRIPSLLAELHLIGRGVDFIRTHEPDTLSDAWIFYRELREC